MSSVPSLEQISRSFQGWEGGAGHATLHALVLTYARHHDPAVKAAREAMERADRNKSSHPDDVPGYVMLHEDDWEALRSALRLLDEGGAA